ncbi:unnamed protein product [Alopecurus aequalis]
MAGSPINSEPWLPLDLLIDEVLTRLPSVTVVRSRLVCRAWNVALTSDHFLAAHAAKHPPEILFFPPAEGPATSFYACSLPPAAGAGAGAARHLLTVGNLAVEYVVLSRRPCRGLTLFRDARSPSDYYVCNLSTGQNTVLPPCEPARMFRIENFTVPYYSPRFHPTMAPWAPFEFSSAGLCFDRKTGKHKVVRFFANRMSELKCEVHTLGSQGWRPCAGKVPPQGPWPGLMKYLSGLPPVAVGEYFFWLLKAHSNVGARPHDPHILYFSVADEHFGWGRTPPRVSGWRRNHCIRQLAELDGSLCAVAYGLPRRYALGGEERVIELLTWSPGAASSSPPSWKTRYRIDLATLPQPVRDELDNESHIIVPLCTTTGGKVVLLATGHHKVFAYDAARNAVEKVFSMEDYVDFPVCHSEARLHINVCLHEERVADVPKAPEDADGAKRLQVKLGDGATVVGRREKHRRLCDKCVAAGHGNECVSAGWEQMLWTPALRDHLPPRQYIA